jgi:hypothetical protein
MIERRSFLQAALQSAVAGVALASAPRPHAEPLPAALPGEVREALGQALGDAELAARLAPVLLDVGFTWSPPTQPARAFRTIVAYSFGNRAPEPGSSRPAPGPINQELAIAVQEAQHRSGASVIYAQWEIAGFLGRQEGAAKIVAVEPVIAADHSVTYLSTDGVAQTAVTDAGGAANLGRVCVVAHHDHAKRCVETSRARGMDAWGMEGLTLPVNYDRASDQPWTRDRETYLIHDMAAQLFMIRAARIAAQRS